jgi:hypothetical protein
LCPVVWHSSVIRQARERKSVQVCILHGGSLQVFSPRHYCEGSEEQLVHSERFLSFVLVTLHSIESALYSVDTLYAIQMCNVQSPLTVVLLVYL